MATQEKKRRPKNCRSMGVWLCLPAMEAGQQNCQRKCSPSLAPNIDRTGPRMTMLSLKPYKEICTMPIHRGNGWKEATFVQISSSYRD
uniref:Uncharacterized protein n=1 Tax=Oryza glaberrima TaxID=4538 RepID=I1QC94_ORYGL